MIVVFKHRRPAVIFFTKAAASSFLVTGILLFIVSVTVNVQLVSASEKSQVIDVKVAVLKNFPPQYSLSEKGTPQGFAIDIIEEIGRLSHLKIQYVIKDTWVEMMNALQSGEVDIIPNMGITEPRRLVFSFSQPVETFTISLFVRKNETRIQDTKSLANRTVAVVRLNIGEVIARDIEKVRVHTFEHTEDALFNLLSGGVDAFIFPEPVLWKMARNSGVDARIKVLDVPLRKIQRGVAVKKGNNALLARINAGITALAGTRTYQKIYLSWYAKPTPYWTPKKIMTGMASVVIIVIFIMNYWRSRSLSVINRQLAQQVQKRKISEQQLKKAHDTLEEKVHERTQQLSRTVSELQDTNMALKESEQNYKKAYEQVKTLSGLLPICAHCKKIRDDQGYWNQIESYIEDHSDVAFSHSLCPHCTRELYGNEDWYQEQEDDTGNTT